VSAADRCPTCKTDLVHTHSACTGRERDLENRIARLQELDKKHREQIAELTRTVVRRNGRIERLEKELAGGPPHEIEGFARRVAADLEAIAGKVRRVLDERGRG
jgi:hypothetical protein